MNNKPTPGKTHLPGSKSWIVTVFLVLFVLQVVWSVSEYQNRKNEIIEIMHGQANSLALAIGFSGSEHIQLSQRVTRHTIDRIFRALRTIAQFDQQNRLTQDLLETFAADNNLYRIILYNKEMRIDYSTHSGFGSGGGGGYRFGQGNRQNSEREIQGVGPGFTDNFRTLIEGKTDSLAVGLLPNQTKAAEKLGISERVIRYKIDKYQLK